ncbi:MAG: peptidoglycan editing factor PgeF [Bacteroidales bacterium]
MITASLGRLNTFHFQIFQDQPHLVHFTTSREEPNGFNLGVYGDEDPLEARRNRDQLAAALGISGEKLLFTRQVHGSEFRLIDKNFFLLTAEERNKSLDGVDALITAMPGVCLCALAADCSQVLLYDPQQRVIATVHAGWRGTVNKLVCRVIEKMQMEFGCLPAEILAGIGPCISGRNYEVGEEVAAVFEEQFGLNEKIILRKKEYPKTHVDIPAALRFSMQEMGIQPKHIEESGICTYDNADHFYSARRGAAGRFSSGLIMQDMKR